jgi:hypothetical protein
VKFEYGINCLPFVFQKRKKSKEPDSKTFEELLEELIEPQFEEPIELPKPKVSSRLISVI